MKIQIFFNKIQSGSFIGILRCVCFVILFAGLQSRSFAQNVGINGTGAAPNTSAMLDVTSTNKGILIPQVALTGATDATSITTGNVNSLLVYCTATAGSGSTAVVPGYYYWNSTTSRWCQLMPGTGSSNVMFAGFQVFTASGTFTIPSGVTKVMIEMWGGGGGGGYASAGGTGYGGSGGGSGAYNKSLFTVSSNITVTIGPGGAGGISTHINGYNGTATSVSGGATLSAGGGTGGTGADSNGGVAAGGTATATTTSILGINGYPGGPNIGGASGAAGGNAPAGGAGGQANGNPGLAGAVPGGGGGGAAQSNTLAAGNGGAGAAGMVIIWW